MYLGNVGVAVLTIVTLVQVVNTFLGKIDSHQSGVNTDCLNQESLSQNAHNISSQVGIATSEHKLEEKIINVETKLDELNASVLYLARENSRQVSEMPRVANHSRPSIADDGKEEYEEALSMAKGVVSAAISEGGWSEDHARYFAENNIQLSPNDKAELMNQYLEKIVMPARAEGRNVGIPVF